MKFFYISSLIRHHRNLRKMSVTELSRHLRVTAQFICNIEAGKASFPNYKIPVLARVLKVPETEIIEAIVLDTRDRIQKELRHGERNKKT